MEIQVVNIDDKPFLQELYSHVEYETIGGTQETNAEIKIVKEFLESTKQLDE
jgi:hypothetical protein